MKASWFQKLAVGVGSGLLMLLGGCGGGDSSSTTTTSSSVSGIVQASVLKGVEVCNSDESICTTTDANGRFTLNGVGNGATLKLKIGSTLLGSVTASGSNMTITPALLAENNTTKAAYIGTILHQIGGCTLGASTCDLSNVQAVDIDPNSSASLIQELSTKLQANAPVTVTITTPTGNQNVTVSDANATEYTTLHPEMTSSTYHFSGSAAPGDFATFAFDPSSKVLSYDINGSIYGSQSGSKTLQSLQGNIFFKDSTNNLYFLTQSLSVAMLPMGNSVSFIVGLQTPSNTVDTSLIVNKRFNYIEFDSQGNPYVGIIDINATNPTDTNGTWHDLLDGTSGTWRVNGNHLDVFDSNGAKQANVIIKAGVSRAGFIVDNVGGAGFGVGVEAKALHASDMTGTYSYMDVSANTDGSDDICFGSATVSDINATYGFASYQDNLCFNTNSGQIAATDSGSFALKLNPTVDINATLTNVPLNGVTQVYSNGVATQTFIMLDPQDGYFIRVNMNSTTGRSITIGSNRPIE